MWELQIGVYRTVLSLYFSVNSDRKVPKEHRQRAGRPLDTCFPFMGLFDRGYTRRGIRKALRMSWRRRFSHTPPNSTQSRCASMVASCAFKLPRREAINSLLVGRLPSGFFCPTRKTVALDRIRGTSSARTALRRSCGYSGLGDFSRNQTLSPSGERVARIRWWVSQGRHRG